MRSFTQPHALLSLSLRRLCSFCSDSSNCVTSTAFLHFLLLRFAPCLPARPPSPHTLFTLPINTTHLPGSTGNPLNYVHNQTSSPNRFSLDFRCCQSRIRSICYAAFAADRKTGHKLTMFQALPASVMLKEINTCCETSSGHHSEVNQSSHPKGQTINPLLKIESLLYLKNLGEEKSTLAL